MSVSSSCSRNALTATSQVMREVVRQVARLDSARRTLDVVVDAHELDSRVAVAELQHYVPRAPIAILRPSDASGVQEMHAGHLTMIRQVRVAEGDHVTSLRAGGISHLRAKRLGAIFRPVQRVECRRTVD